MYKNILFIPVLFLQLNFVNVSGDNSFVVNGADRFTKLLCSENQYLSCLSINQELCLSQMQSISKDCIEKLNAKIPKTPETKHEIKSKVHRKIMTEFSEELYSCLVSNHANMSGLDFDMLNDCHSK